MDSYISIYKHELKKNIFNKIKDKVHEKKINYNLLCLPDDVLIIIICDAICLDINVENFRDDPIILQVHPLFRRYIKYFSDYHWKLICDKITNKMYNNEKQIKNWHGEFLKLSENIYIKLYNFYKQDLFIEIKKIIKKCPKKMYKNNMRKINSKCISIIFNKRYNRDIYKKYTHNYPTIIHYNFRKFMIIIIKNTLVYSKYMNLKDFK